MEIKTIIPKVSTGLGEREGHHVWWREAFNQEEEVVLKGGQVLYMRPISNSTVQKHIHVYVCMCIYMCVYLNTFTVPLMMIYYGDNSNTTLITNIPISLLQEPQHSSYSFLLKLIVYYVDQFSHYVFFGP